MADRPAARVDLGIHRMAQVRDGTCFENPRALKRSLTKLKRLQRVVSRRQKGRCNQVSDCVGEPEWAWDDEEPSPPAGDCGRGPGRVPATAGLQGPGVRL
jgi:hypothetical protein